MLAYGSKKVTDLQFLGLRVSHDALLMQTELSPFSEPSPCNFSRQMHQPESHPSGPQPLF
jgi:hypothetical protein